MGEHQRAVPENKYPEQVGKQPEYKVICKFVGFQILLFCIEIKILKA
jgi:hypothetical protein